MKITVELIYDFLDGQLSADEVEALEAWISAHPNNARRFVRASTAHSHLYDALRARDMQSLLGGSGDFDEAKVAELLFTESAADHDAGAEPAREAPKQTAWKPRIPVWWLFSRQVRYAALAACVLVAILGVRYFWIGSGAGIATLTRQHAARWETEGHATATGERLQAGKMSLVGGSAEVTLGRGATVILEAPTAIELTNDNELTLASGKLSARVRPSARGFTVVTPAGSIVDLGTEFGVEVGAGGQVEFAVFAGEIELRVPGASEKLNPHSVRVEAGNAGTIPAGQSLPEHVRPIESADRTRFARSWDEFVHRPTVFGDVRYEPQGVPTVAPGKCVDEERVWLFPERLNVTLEEPLRDVVTRPGSYGPVATGKTRVRGKSVPAGRVVNSYFLHFDPDIRKNQKERQAALVLEFPTPIIGVIFSDEGLYASDPVFGLEGFPPSADRGLRGLDDEMFAIGRDRMKIQIRFRTKQYIDQARILTEAVEEGS